MLVTGVLALVSITLVFALLLRGSGTELLPALAGLSPWGILIPAALGALYQILEAMICRSIVRVHLPDFPLRQAWRVVHLKVFGDVASFGTASIPMQSYALHRQGLPAGAGVGLMTLEYVFHKLSILLYAAVMLAFQWTWLKQTSRGVTGYLLPACGVIALIICALVLVCTWDRVQRLVLWAADRLPDTQRWNGRKEKLRIQLGALYTQSQALLRDRRCCGKILLLNAAKLFVLFSIPAVCMQALDLACPPFYRVQLLSALMLLITSVLPNVAGAGPAEFAFLLIFTPYVGGDGAALALILYRAATYYAPFLVSLIPFCTIQGR